MPQRGIVEIPTPLFTEHDEVRQQLQTFASIFFTVNTNIKTSGGVDPCSWHAVAGSSSVSVLNLLLLLVFGGSVERGGHSRRKMEGSIAAFVASLGILLFLLVDAQNTRTYDFQIVSTPVTRLGTSKNIVTVNGEYPGPTVYANDGDRLLINVVNTLNTKISIHWHGVRQVRTPWFDGPAYITQCPITKDESFLYNFTVEGHKGTLFWHAHILWLRATVYGAIVIYPKKTSAYPFRNPYEEHMILLGEWWNSPIQTIEKDALRLGGGPNQSDAYTINGFPGPSYRDSDDSDVFTLSAIKGKTYLLRIINAALNTELFFSVANHSITVVEVDGEYTKQYTTNTLLLTPGQTTNVLLTTDQPCSKYFMTASPYISASGIPYTATPATAVLDYIACGGNAVWTKPRSPKRPKDNDTGYATLFSTNIRSLAVNVPQTVDKEIFMTVGLGIRDCAPGKTCSASGGGNLTATFSNYSFILPSRSILEAHYYNIPGVFTTDFPSKPEHPFNYTGDPPKNVRPADGTRVSVIPYGSNVQMVFQNTMVAGFENHPIHLHGYNFYIVGHGFGNYDPKTAVLNLVDPPSRNTVGVPSGGWAVIRFKADNPGVWFMHCHLEIHTTWGLATAILVENGNSTEQSIVPPPDDLPTC